MRLAFLSCLLLCCVACSSRATQLLVVVDTDLQVPEEIARVEVSVFGDAADPLELSFGEREPLTLPLSFGIAPRSGSPSVRLQVRGLSPDGTVLVQRDASTSFATGRAVLLPMPLSRACVPAGRCEGGEDTCADGACVSAEIDPTTLADVDPSAAPPRLLSPTPAQDAGPAPVDAASACVVGATCDTGMPCDIGEMQCGPPVCVRVGQLPAGAICGEDGRECDAEGRCGVMP